MSATATSVITIRCQDCPDWEYTGVAAEARAEWIEHRWEEHGDYQSEVPKAEALEATPPRTEVDEIMDEVEEALEPRRPEPEPEVETRPVAVPQNGEQRPRGYWTRETAIAAIQAFASEHGRPPVSQEVGGGVPGIQALRRLFGTFADAIEAAGFDRPVRGGRKPRTARPKPPPTSPAKRQPSGPKPTPIASKPAPAQPSEGTPEGTLVGNAERFSELASEIVSTRARLAQLEDEARSLLDAIGQEIAR